MPDRVDEVLESPLPERSPRCGAEMEEDGVAQQYQVDIPPVKPQVTQINVHVGHCTRCNKRVQGRDPYEVIVFLLYAAVTRTRLTKRRRG